MAALLLVGYDPESADLSTSRKAWRVEFGALSPRIATHSAFYPRTFILALPGETKELSRNVDFAKEIKPHTSRYRRRPYPGTFL